MSAFIPLRGTKSTIESRLGFAALILAVTAGLVHIPQLPFWIASLISSYHFAPSAAGLMVTVYIGGVLFASALLGRYFQAIEPAIWAGGGLAFAGVIFIACEHVVRIFALYSLHFLAGIGAGIALSCALGTIGRARDPHLLYSKVNVGFSIIVFGLLSLMPSIGARYGANGVFGAMAGIMLVAFVAVVVAFPGVKLESDTTRAADGCPAADAGRRGVGVCFLAVACITTGHGAAWGFAAQLARVHHFPAGSVELAFAAAGVVAIVVPILCGVFDKSWPPSRVCAASAVTYGVMAVLVASTSSFPVFAVALSGLMGAFLFVQIFAFGLIASLDPSGRASATLPAILMLGAAIGPFVGGAVIGVWGNYALGLNALVLCAVGAALFARLGRRSRGTQ